MLPIQFHLFSRTEQGLFRTNGRSALHLCAPLCLPSLPHDSLPRTLLIPQASKGYPYHHLGREQSGTDEFLIFKTHCGREHTPWKVYLLGEHLSKTQGFLMTYSPMKEGHKGLPTTWAL